MLDWLLGFGLFWLPVGMACTPGNDPRGPYHWSLGLFLFAPSLWLFVRHPRRLMLPWVTLQPLRLCLALLVWSGITLFWAEGGHVAERLKSAIFVLLFLNGWMAWSGSSAARSQRLLYLAGLAMALCALVAMIAFPWRDIPWTRRMIGLALLNGPNLSAYAMGASFLFLGQLLPPPNWQRYVWSLSLLLLLAFVAWTGSRGAWLALFICLISMPLWSPDRRSRWWAGGALIVVILVIFLSPVELLHRGLSYRPNILEQATDLIARHPWTGLGLGSVYQITVGGESWSHSHSLFTNVAIEIGLPGLALWLVLWFWTGWEGWRHRRHVLGRVLVALWIFATVALQFDGPMLLHSPRAEWLLTWLPVAIAMQLFMHHKHMMAADPQPEIVP